MKIRTKTNQDDLTELTENDCTAPRRNRKRSKSKKKNQTKQTTMYDYAASISYKHKQFYSSLDNTTTTKTITKRQKRSWTVRERSFYSFNIRFICQGIRTIIIDHQEIEDYHS